MLPMIGSLSGRVFSTGLPVHQPLADPETAFIAAAAELDLGPVLAVPLLGSTQVRGVLWVGRRRGQPPFGSEELDMAAGFANQAALAIELSEARAEQQRAAMLDERDRIAADLHDHVIQRLFAAGLSLQSTAATLGPGAPTDRILATVDDLDDTIRQIRTSIFQLQQVRHPAVRGLRTRLLDVAAELTAVLGFAPTLRMSGLLDTLPDDLGEDVVAVARESLTNVARHARAGSVEIDVAAVESRLTVEVRDDGIGPGSPNRRSGLDNLQRRAEHRGGTFEVQARKPAGTWLCWSVPLDR
jgi:signal transduction histidine kinase